MLDKCTQYPAPHQSQLTHRPTPGTCIPIAPQPHIFKTLEDHPETATADGEAHTGLVNKLVQSNILCAMLSFSGDILICP